MNINFYNDGYRTARGNDSGWAKGTSGLFLPPLARRKRRYDQPIALDFFAGCGGFSLGIKSGGFHVIGAVEWWPTAASTYLHNLGSPDTKLHLGNTPSAEASKAEKKQWAAMAGQTIPARDFFPSAGTNHHAEWGAPTEHFWLASAADLTGEAMLEMMELEPGDLDLVFGGPPCQGFSFSGRRNVMDPRNSLVFEFARLVCELKPKCFAMENVPGMVSMVTPEGIPVLDALAHVFEEGGLGSYEALKRMLLGTSGVGAALRQKTTKKPDVKETTQTAEDLENQLDLFGEAALA